MRWCLPQTTTKPRRTLWWPPGETMTAMTTARTSPTPSTRAAARCLAASRLPPPKSRLPTTTPSRCSPRISSTRFSSCATCRPSTRCRPRVADPVAGLLSPIRSPRTSPTQCRGWCSTTPPPRAASPARRPPRPPRSPSPTPRAMKPKASTSRSPSLSRSPARPGWWFPPHRWWWRRARPPLIPCA